MVFAANGWKTTPRHHTVADQDLRVTGIESVDYREAKVANFDRKAQPGAESATITARRSVWRPPLVLSPATVGGLAFALAQLDHIKGVGGEAVLHEERPPTSPSVHPHGRVPSVAFESIAAHPHRLRLAAHVVYVQPQLARGQSPTPVPLHGLSRPQLFRQGGYMLALHPKHSAVGGGDDVASIDMAPAQMIALTLLYVRTASDQTGDPTAVRSGTSRMPT